MTDTTTQAARLIELAAKPGVTPGPLEAWNDEVQRAEDGVQILHVLSCAYNVDEQGRPTNAADADWFAACDPQTITAICQALASLTAERDELRAALLAVRDSYRMGRAAILDSVLDQVNSALKESPHV